MSKYQLGKDIQFLTERINSLEKLVLNNFNRSNLTPSNEARLVPEIIKKDRNLFRDFVELETVYKPDGRIDGIWYEKSCLSLGVKMKIVGSNIEVSKTTGDSNQGIDIKNTSDGTIVVDINDGSSLTGQLEINPDENANIKTASSENEEATVYSFLVRECLHWYYKFPWGGEDRFPWETRTRRYEDNISNIKIDVGQSSDGTDGNSPGNQSAEYVIDSRGQISSRSQ